MDPQRNINATLVDLLDRVLDKGLVIHADLIVSVAGIPLIGVNLRAALAGMETMLKYGIMQAWDERTRAWERDYRCKKKNALVQGEEEILKMLGAFYSNEGSSMEFISGGEQVICSGKMWYLTDAEGIMDDTWRPGHLYLTDKRLCWCYDFQRRVVTEIPVSGIIGSVIEARSHSDFLNKEKVMDVVYAANGTRRVATFSGDALEEWDQIIKRIISGQRVSLAVDETETCPQCGRTASIKELLENGCAGCGWVSPKVVSLRPIGAYALSEL